MLPALALALLQQTAAFTSPPGGDPTGYWQQSASYSIVATLDEARSVLHATGTLTYVNQSPDTLTEFYVHQHLNAFRPGSAWSEVDEREGVERFQKLADPDYAYERFTADPRFDGVPVAATYPGAPDSTVAHFVLPRALLPGDTLHVEFAWDARPSTRPRRQGRRGRSYDFAQWFPKVAVYDRGGWEPNPLRPSGEFYGEFGTFDVTLLLRDDQVLGTTGVVVDGDPGWRRALRWGVVARQPSAYADVPPMPEVTVPPGYRSVRVVARDVHHFGWSVSPDYRYEGGYYLRPDRSLSTRWPTWDSVAVNVLYRPGDEAQWGRGQVVARTTTALRWLESIYGPYAYPQMTVLHRIEGGGTEFPMMQMNGSPSQGLNLHEGGHVFTYGILANNEWRSGWMDEGLTSYQSSWFASATPQDRPARPAPAPAAAAGYARHRLTPSPGSGALMGLARLDLLGRSEPMGTAGHDFNESAIYSSMVYSRAELMYGALRDVMGDDAFRQFLRTYYDRWALRHVDEAAMRAAAESAHDAPLDWFFNQWVHRTGVVDYALRDVVVSRDGEEWVTTATVVKQGDYWHPMPLGVRVDSGWVIARGVPLSTRQTLTVRTARQPLAVALDPYRSTPDWYAPNDIDVSHPRLDPATAVVAMDWPFLEHRLADRYVTGLAPLAWYGRADGVVPAFRARSSYQGSYDRREIGLAVATRLARAAVPAGGTTASPREWSRLQGWMTVENPILPGNGRPLMGASGGLWLLDGVAMASLGQRWDRSRFLAAGDRVTHELTLTGTYPYDRALMDGRRWGGRAATDLTWSYARTSPADRGTALRFSVGGGVQSGYGDGADPYARAEAAWGVARGSAGGLLSHRVRLFAGVTVDAPAERGLYLSARTPTATFTNHWWRPDGGILSATDIPYLPLGGGGLRGYDALASTRALVALNVEEGVRLHRFGASPRSPALHANLFADVGVRDAAGTTAGQRLLADAGIGLALRGWLFDRELKLRLDLPAYVRYPELAVGERGRRESEHPDPFELRWSFSFDDLW
ncbi:MAG: M1 family aminopeptidase [Gemmatimonadaceae bacterium]